MPQSNDVRRAKYAELGAAGLCVQCAKARDTQNKMCSRCLDRSKEASGRWKAKQDRYDRKKALLRKYGLTLTEYDAMLAAQGGGCAICRTKEPVRSWTVDHCHGSGMVRAILCHPCNVGLGQFRDDPALLEKAAEYLKRHRGLIAV